jgi:hypothetical protein
MKNETRKKAWQKPQLVIMVRSKPEETVLQGCKTDTFPKTGASAIDQQRDCIFHFCGLCDSVVPS